MLVLINEFGGPIAIRPDCVKAFEENNGPLKSVHKKAATVVYTVYGDEYYVQESFNDIVTKLEALFGNNNQEVA